MLYNSTDFVQLYNYTELRKRPQRHSLWLNLTQHEETHYSAQTLEGLAD